VKLGREEDRMITDRAALALTIVFWATLLAVVVACAWLRRKEWKDLHI
jgi:nitrogen fixation protein FixH